MILFWAGMAGKEHSYVLQYSLPKKTDNFTKMNTLEDYTMTWLLLCVCGLHIPSPVLCVWGFNVVLNNFSVIQQIRSPLPVMHLLVVKGIHANC